MLGDKSKRRSAIERERAPQKARPASAIHLTKTATQETAVTMFVRVCVRACVRAKLDGQSGRRRPGNAKLNDLVNIPVVYLSLKRSSVGTCSKFQNSLLR